MKILILHPNFPGQFKHIAKELASDKNNEVVFACRYGNKKDIEGVRKIKYRVTREPSKDAHRYLIGFEQAVCAGQAVYRMCDKLKKEGFTPDVILSHSGWGEGMFFKDVFPNTPLINYMEYYYRSFGADIHFDPKEKINPDVLARTRIRNATHLINLEACDLAISPTQWQASLHPREFHKKFSIIHEGVDTSFYKPKSTTTLTLPNGVKLDKTKDEIFTYVARNFEPYRGFPQVMKGVETLLKERPNLHFLMVGGDEVSYGKKLEGTTYRKEMMKQLDIDSSRVHWLGILGSEQYKTVLQYSDVHVYFTIPFVLSWSCLEAMSTGCVVVGSDTKPVREVIRHQKNGYLVDFFDIKALTKQVIDILDHKEKNLKIRRAARQTIEEKYNVNQSLAAYKTLLNKVIAKSKG